MPRELTAHVLREGVVACGNPSGRPCDWSAETLHEHTWVVYPVNSNCLDCLAKLGFTPHHFLAGTVSPVRCQCGREKEHPLHA